MQSLDDKNHIHGLLTPHNYIISYLISQFTLHIMHSLYLLKLISPKDWDFGTCLAFKNKPNNTALVCLALDIYHLNKINFMQHSAVLWLAKKIIYQFFINWPFSNFLKALFKLCLKSFSVHTDFAHSCIYKYIQIHAHCHKDKNGTLKKKKKHHTQKKQKLNSCFIFTFFWTTIHLISAWAWRTRFPLV